MFSISELRVDLILASSPFRLSIFFQISGSVPKWGSGRGSRVGIRPPPVNTIEECLHVGSGRSTPLEYYLGGAFTPWNILATLFPPPWTSQPLVLKVKFTWLPEVALHLQLHSAKQQAYSALRGTLGSKFGGGGGGGVYMYYKHIRTV